MQHHDSSIGAGRQAVPGIGPRPATGRLPRQEQSIDCPILGGFSLRDNVPGNAGWQREASSPRRRSFAADTLP